MKKVYKVGVGAISAGIFLLAWIVMLVMGGLHDTWVAVPAVGYWQALPIATALIIAKSVFSGTDAGGKSS